MSLRSRRISRRKTKSRRAEREASKSDQIVISAGQSLSWQALPNYDLSICYPVIDGRTVLACGITGPTYAGPDFVDMSAPPGVEYLGRLERVYDVTEPDVSDFAGSDSFFPVIDAGVSTIHVGNVGISAGSGANATLVSNSTEHNWTIGGGSGSGGASSVRIINIPMCQVAREPTPEERATWQAQIEAARLAKEQREASRAQAAKRARGLLLRHLSDVQREEFEKSSKFHATSPTSGKRYLINRYLSANIDALDQEGKVEHRLCIHIDPEIDAPVDDTLLVQKLMIENGLEDELVRLANKHPVRGAPYVFTGGNGGNGGAVTITGYGDSGISIATGADFALMSNPRPNPPQITAGRRVAVEEAFVNPPMLNPETFELVERQGANQPPPPAGSPDAPQVMQVYLQNGAPVYYTAMTMDSSIPQVYRMDGTRLCG